MNTRIAYRYSVLIERIAIFNLWDQSAVDATTEDILAAIMGGDLETEPVRIDGQEFIALYVGRCLVSRIGYSAAERPSAKLNVDGLSVDVRSSPGTSGGFKIRCATQDDAETVMESLDMSFAVSNADVIDPDR